LGYFENPTKPKKPDKDKVKEEDKVKDKDNNIHTQKSGSKSETDKEGKHYDG
jgi:hypothetical protein